MGRKFHCVKCDSNKATVRYVGNKDSQGKLVSEFLSLCCDICLYRWNEDTNPNLKKKKGEEDE